MPVSRVLVGASVAVGFAVAAVHADTIFLTNGGKLHGTVVDPDADPIILRLPKGRISVNPRTIKSIRFDNVRTNPMIALFVYRSPSI